ADEDPTETAKNPLIPADRVHLPEGRRLNLTRIDAQLTSSDGSSHVLSLGEFAALYLSVWSPAVWGDEVPLAKFAPDATAPPQVRPLRWDSKPPPFVHDWPKEGGAIVMPAIQFPERVAGHLYVVPRGEQKPPASEFDKQKSLREQFEVIREFHKNLPKVQRALANVPTYMALDDHDVTDDYFLNPVWRTRVLGRKLGQAILGNGMIAYALFQDWGNDPKAYEPGQNGPRPKAELLGLVPKLFPESPSLTKGPDKTTFEQIAKLLGHDQPLTPTPDGRFNSADPPLRWHFTVDGPKHRVIALDNRPRRRS